MNLYCQCTVGSFHKRRGSADRSTTGTGLFGAAWKILVIGASLKNLSLKVLKTTIMTQMNFKFVTKFAL